MKTAFAYWKDTGNIDLILTAESETETAMLGLLKDRPPRWSEGSTGDIRKHELIFEPTGKQKVALGAMKKER